jgi:signal transduction histidine kinase/HAMP domain-containing protein
VIEEFFVQTSSIINRLKSVMTVIALFIIFCGVALYISSISTVKGLQDLKNANDFINLNTQIIEILNGADKMTDKVLTRSDMIEMQFSFHENMRLARLLLNQSLPLVKNKAEIYKMLNEAQLSINQLEKAFSIKDGQDFKADLMEGRQHIIDIKESLSKAQILVKKTTDETFSKMYEHRFKPITIGVTLSVLFFIFVMIFGVSLSRRIGLSISHLLEATDKVSQGDLNYEVQVLEHDEIGRLTNAFNRMVSNLKSGQNQLSQAIDRTVRLQSITASFSEALTPDQVFDIIFRQAFESLHAVAASIVLVSEDKNFVELKRMGGYDQKTFDKFKRFSMDMDYPSTRAIRFGKPIFIETVDIKNEFKDLIDDSFTPKGSSIACLPLIIGSEVLGALSFSFEISRQFNNSEKDFMLALTRQCAQAIHRSMLYDDAKKAIEVRDEFLSIASHELRTPLTPLKLQIQGVARQIRNGKAELTPERLQKLLDTSERQINRLSGLIDDLLDVSRITSGKLILKKSNFRLSEVIEEVLSNYSQPLKDAHSLIDLVTKEDVEGHWDRVRLEQVIINLLTNALKYAPGKTIHIELARKNDKAIIKVRDEGPGIAEQDFERIFYRFERVASKENVGGLGLGLYISKQIVDAHHGSIYVESIFGTGSTFTVELPLGEKNES